MHNNIKKLIDQINRAEEAKSPLEKLNILLGDEDIIDNEIKDIKENPEHYEDDNHDCHADTPEGHCSHLSHKDYE